MKSLKSLAVKCLVAAGTICVTASAWSYTIGGGGTEVGGLDTLFSTNTIPANQGTTTVLNWINSFISPDASNLTRTDSPTFFQVDNQSSYYAIGLSGTPDYFHLFNANQDALYTNDGAGVGALSWGVFDITPFIVACNGNNPGTCNSLNIKGATGTISHVDSVGTHTSVPEPTSLGLLAAGILGLAATRRLTRKA